MAERVSQADHEEEGELGQDKNKNSPEDHHRYTVTVEESPDVDFSEEQQSTTQPEEESECPGCQSLGIVTLPCGHKLCTSCIELSQGQLGHADCTICYGSQLMDSVLHCLLETLFHGQPRRPELTPGTVREAVRVTEEGWRGFTGFRGVEKEELCLEHKEVLSVFCLEEGKPLCQHCQANDHKEHQSCSIKEAVLDCKRELRSAIRSLQEQLESITSIRQTWEDAAAHIKSQSEQTAQVLREEFEKMHQYLRDEETTLLSQLKQEEDEKNQRMKEKIDKINSDIRSLTNYIRETEEALGLDDFLFLKNYKKTSERAQGRVEEPEDEAGALLDVAKHQSCIQHQVWEKMLRMIQYFPVTMDPNTGSVSLGVSPDLSSVFVCEDQLLPDNPERFVSPQSILGSQSFSSGRHSWEVEVGDNSHWSLGVASESVHRKNWSNSDLNPSPALDADIDSTNCLWTISLYSGEFWAYPGYSTPLKLRRRPVKIRIQLDWERGCLTFSEANDNTLIYRFKKQWNGKLRPYFSTTCSKHPLKIAPGKVTVNIE